MTNRPSGHPHHGMELAGGMLSTARTLAAKNAKVRKITCALHLRNSPRLPGLLSQHQDTPW